MIIRNQRSHDHNVAESTSTPEPSLNCTFQQSKEEVKIGGTILYGTRLPYAPSSMASDLSRITPNLQSEVHLMRHFSKLPSSYCQDVIGKSYDERDKVTTRISEKTIQAALETKGSKFSESFTVHTPRELIEFATELAVQQAQREQLLLLEKDPGNVAILSLDMPHLVGTDGIVPLDAINQDLTPLNRESRGLLAGDTLKVNTVKGHPGLPTKRFTAIFGIIDGNAILYTAYPGKVAPELPRDEQSFEEQKINQEFWSTHAFIR